MYFYSGLLKQPLKETQENMGFASFFIDRLYKKRGMINHITSKE